MAHLEVQEQLPGLAAQVAALGDGDEPGLDPAGRLQDETHLERTSQGDMEDGKVRLEHDQQDDFDIVPSCSRSQLTSQFSNHCWTTKHTNDTKTNMN